MLKILFWSNEKWRDEAPNRLVRRLEPAGGHFIPSQMAAHDANSGSGPTHWTRLSCHRFRANEVRLQLSVPAYNLVNLWRRLGLPQSLGLGEFEPAVLGFPTVKGLLADAVLTADLGRLDAGLGLLQDANDLFFAVSFALHSCSFPPAPPPAAKPPGSSHLPWSSFRGQGHLVESAAQAAFNGRGERTRASNVEEGNTCCIGAVDSTTLIEPGSPREKVDESLSSS